MEAVPAPTSLRGASMTNRDDSDTMLRLRATEAVLSGLHVVYKSGRHGSDYINLDPAFANSGLMDVLGNRLAGPFRDQQIDVVVGPAVGGTALSVYARAGFAPTGRLPDAIWADKVDGGFAFTRAGFAAAVKGKRVLVVEDVLNLGTSVRAVCRLVRQAGGIIVGVSVVCNRGNLTATKLRIPRLESLVTPADLAGLDLQTFAASRCPLCKARQPIATNIGHGAAFKAAHSDYPGGFIELANVA